MNPISPRSYAEKLLIQRVPTLAADPDLLAIRQDAVANPSCLVAGPAHDHNVRYMNRGLPLNNAPFDILRWIGASMTFEQADTFNDNSILLAHDPQHAANFVEISSGNYLNLIILTNLYAASL